MRSYQRLQERLSGARRGAGEFTRGYRAAGDRIRLLRGLAFETSRGNRAAGLLAVVESFEHQMAIAFGMEDAEAGELTRYDAGYLTYCLLKGRDRRFADDLHAAIRKTGK